jgi:hypothetical protein
MTLTGWLSGIAHSVQGAAGRGVSVVTSTIDGIGHLPGAALQVVETDVSKARQSIASSLPVVKTGVSDIVDGVRSGASQFWENAKEGGRFGLKLVGAGAQGALEGARELGIPDFIKRMEGNWADNTNLPGLLSSSTFPLLAIAGIVGAIAVMKVL